MKKIQGILTFTIEDDNGKFRNHGEAYGEQQYLYIGKNCLNIFR